MLEQATFTSSPLGKASEKQTKAIVDQERRQVGTVKVLKPTEQHHKPKLIEGVFPKELKIMKLKKN